MNLDDARTIIAHDLPGVQSVMLTQQQWEILQFIIRMSPNAVRSHEITSQFGLSPQHTATVMATLFDKGYVSRSTEKSPSGGHEYEFRFRPLYS